MSPAPSLPVFSAVPTEAEITRARVFAEPLVPLEETPSGEENGALAQAITAYVAAGRDEALGPFEAFVAAHPRSAWRAPLLTNLGVAYRRTGYFSRALAAWEEAWTLTKTEQQPNGHD